MKLFNQLEYIDFGIAVYEHNVKKGWWDAPVRPFANTLDLIHSELSEATEADRKNLADDKLPDFPGTWVEIADTGIRCLDCIAHYNQLHQRDGLQPLRSTTFGEMNMDVRAEIDQAWRHYGQYGNAASCCVYLWHAVHKLHYMAHNMGFDLLEMMKAKQAYNVTRKDHTRKARAAQHGKKY